MLTLPYLDYHAHIAYAYCAVVNVRLAIYLPYLLLTLVIEAPIVLALLVRRCGWVRSILVAVLASSITHPLLWFEWPHAISLRQHYWWYVATGETLVFLIEAGVFLLIALPKLGSLRNRIEIASGVSLLANLASWGTGTLMQYCGLLQVYAATLTCWLDRATNWVRSS